MHQGTQIVVNWHVTEACNYRCQFCYAHWRRPTRAELWRDSAASQALLEELARFFGPDMPRWADHFSTRPRLNLAGGEPTLWRDHLARIVEDAANAGFDVSLISNGSRPDALLGIVRKLTLLGLSVDSTRSEGNVAIGRVDRAGAQISPDRLVRMVRELRSANPGLQVKVNTVVNAVNSEEDFSAIIAAIAPERWKVLRVLPSFTDALTITDANFRGFVARHRAMESIMCIEDNHEMVHAYLMIDPHGRFFQNRPGREGYDYSAPILEVGVALAFSQIAFDLGTFLGRYSAPEHEE